MAPKSNHLGVCVATATVVLGAVALAACGEASEGDAPVRGESEESADDAIREASKDSDDTQNTSEAPADRDPALLALRYDDMAVASDPSNAVVDNPAAQALGHRLFFDPSFSGPLIDGDNNGGGGTLGLMGEAGRVSCASCHVPQDGFVDTRSPHRQISLAAMWTTRRTPTLLDVAFAPYFNWDGRRDSLWAQAIGVMESHREFNSGRLFVARRILEDYGDEYQAVFEEDLSALEDSDRFPQLAPTEAGCEEVARITGPEYICRGKPGDEADYDNMSSADQDFVTQVTVNAAKAIAAYVTLLRCGPSRFDAWLDGDDSALSESEQRGAELFVGKARCNDCHTGPRFTDDQFHNVGLTPATVAVAFVDSNDRGAAAAAEEAAGDPLDTRGAFSDAERAPALEANPRLEGAFRTPTLRCISDQPSFMHTGQHTSLESVVRFFSKGGDPTGYPGSNELEATELSDEEVADLTAFIAALQGDGPATELLEAP